MTEETLIQKYLGVPYKHLGRDPKEGLDCYGLIMCIYADMEIDLQDFAYREEWADNGEDYFVDNYALQWTEVVTPHRLDVALFRNSKGVANHAGVVLTGNRFIQSVRSTGVVICKLNEKIWYNRLVGFYRYKK